MKKYIAPEVEIKKFNVENIMAESGIAIDTVSDATTNVNNSTTVSYGDLFTIN